MALSAFSLFGNKAIHSEAKPAYCTANPANTNGMVKHNTKMVGPMELADITSGKMKNGTRVNGVPKHMRNRPVSPAPSLSVAANVCADSSFSMLGTVWTQIKEYCFKHRRYGFLAFGQQ